MTGILGRIRVGPEAQRHQESAVLGAMKDRMLTFFLETGDAIPRRLDPH
jgi:hypothetical protein